MVFTLRVRVASGEVEIQGSRSEIYETIDELPKIVSKVREALSVSQAEMEQRVGDTAFQVAPEELERAPGIDRATGLNDAIVKILSTEWGRRPRKWSELDHALRQNALNYSRGSITGALAYLVRSSRLRRLLINGVYGYQLPPQRPLSPILESDKTESVSPQSLGNVGEALGKHGKAETSIILQQIENKLIPQGFFSTAKSTGEVRSELERLLGLEFQSRKVSQALGEFYQKALLKRTGSTGNFRYVII
jgi:hypothetical protein